MPPDHGSMWSYLIERYPDIFSNTGPEAFDPSGVSVDDWRRALTLTERLATITGHRDEALSTDNDEQARRRLSLWLLEPAFAGDEFLLEERFATYGLNRWHILEALGEPENITWSRSPSDKRWAAEIEEIFSQESNGWCSEDSEWTQGFLGFVAPVVNLAREKLRQRVAKIVDGKASLPIDARSAEQLLLPGLLAKLSQWISRTMILELNVLRLTGDLHGDTPEERFGSFADQLQRPETALRILREYPVLARQIAEGADRWVETSTEFVRHLCEDWEQLKHSFFQNEPGRVAEIDTGAGDSHRGGRAVLIVKFESEAKLVYKPRSLAVEARFQELLSWINDRGSLNSGDPESPEFRTLMVMDRDDHGWVEFVEAESCESEEGLQRFYFRQGGYLALLYALCTTDMHFENCIAAGEHPMIVDLETLFHRPPQDQREPETAVEKLVSERTSDSVMQVGLLPQRFWGNESNEGVDISGLGGAPGQTLPQTQPYFKGESTDEMRLSRRQGKLPPQNNRPRVAGSEVESAEYVESIVSGFTKIYRLLEENVADLLSESGPIAVFKRLQVRHVARPTALYARILSEGFHPDLLRDAVDRDRFFDNLWVGSEVDPGAPLIFEFEREDLHGGDVPMFTTTPESYDLYSSGGVCIPNYFSESAMSLSRERLEGLSETDLEMQQWLIRASFATLNSPEGPMRAPRLRPAEGAWTPGSNGDTRSQAGDENDRLLSAASDAADQLGRLSLQSQEDVTWLTLKPDTGRGWNIVPTDESLYDGLLGIALFLGYAGKLTGVRRHTELSRLTASSALRRIKEVIARGDSGGAGETAQLTGSVERSVGAFTGMSGAIYTAAHLGVLWEDEGMLQEATALAGQLVPLVHEDEHLDLLGGSTGCAIIMSNLYELTGENVFRKAAVSCGEHLLVSAKSEKVGIGWYTLAAEVPLAGMSHGASGMAAALVELHGVTGEEKYKQAALDAFRYERELFSEGQGNWLDLRKAQEDESKSQSSWCHGAPGVGLARLRVLQRIEEPTLHQEFEIALRTTLAAGYRDNLSLCHGTLGNADLMLEAESYLQGDAARDCRHALGGIRAGLLRDLERRGWTCGVPFGVQVPGLMTGLAGIGYGLLRLADPDRVPSILSLSPPLTDDRSDRHR